MADQLDLTNRDPNNLNDHLKCCFEDVLAEPENAHSIDFVWKMSYTCFNCWIGMCYKLATLFTGCCIAACWGCEFAGIAYQHIWCVTPCFRVLEINCGIFKKLMYSCLECCCIPCFEACGACFHHFGKK